MQNYIRPLAGASLGLLMLGLGAFNVGQWLKEGFVILAVVALCAELIGFVMAVMTEAAWRAKRYVAAVVCGLILTVCGGFNVIGAERAWDASMARHLDGAREQAQEALDALRGEQRQKLADATRRIEAYNYLLPGPDTMRARQAGMQAAWERATAQARADAETAQAELDRLPVVAEVEPPFEAWMVRTGFALAELIKAMGLWACGFGALLVIAETQRREAETPEPLETALETEPKRQPETAPEPETRAVLQARAKAIKEASPQISYAKLAIELGCSKKHAWTLVNT